MAKKSGKPEQNKNGRNKKPESGRAFLFGSNKAKADEFLADDGFELNGKTKKKKANDFFSDDFASRERKGRRTSTTCMPLINMIALCRK